MKYLHTIIRVTDPDAIVRFFELLGLQEVRRMENERGHFTLILLAPPQNIKGPGGRADAVRAHTRPDLDRTAPGRQSYARC